MLKSVLAATFAVLAVKGDDGFRLDGFASKLSLEKLDVGDILKVPASNKKASTQGVGTLIQIELTQGESATIFETDDIKINFVCESSGSGLQQEIQVFRKHTRDVGALWYSSSSGSYLINPDCHNEFTDFMEFTADGVVNDINGSEIDAANPCGLYGNTWSNGDDVNGNYIDYSRGIQFSNGISFQFGTYEQSGQWLYGGDSEVYRKYFGNSDCNLQLPFFYNVPKGEKFSVYTV